MSALLDQDVHSWETDDVPTYRRLHTGNWLSIGTNGSVEVGAAGIRKFASNWAEARAAGMVTRFACQAHILHGASALCAVLRDHPAMNASIQPGAIVGEVSAGRHAWLGADLTLRLADPDGDQYLALRVAAVLVETAGV